MRLKYQTVSPIDFERELIIKNIHIELKNTGYKITSESEQIIKFKRSIWVLGSRSKAFSSLDGGEFSFNSAKRTSVSLSFFISLENETFLFSFLLITGIFFDFHILYLTILVVVIFPLRVLINKSIAKKMLQNVTSPEQ